jgi:hypothetical protein
MIPIAERMLGCELSAGRVGMVITILFFHFDCRLVVGSPNSEKGKNIEVLPSRGGPPIEHT